MKRSLQSLAEEKTYDILFELENELEIELLKLPEVYYVGKNFSFNKVGVNKLEYPNLEEFKNGKRGFYSISEDLIMVNSLREDILGEETGHFIHHNFVEIFEDYINDFGARSIGEMFGFFCSKLVDGNRKRGYKNDNFANKSLKEKIDHLAFIIREGEYDNLIHQQGYLLGDALYSRYLSGITSTKEIRKIVKNPLKGHNKAFKEFLRLRKKFIN